MQSASLRERPGSCARARGCRAGTCSAMDSEAAIHAGNPSLPEMGVEPSASVQTSGL